MAETQHHTPETSTPSRLRTEELDYPLPESSIATEPSEPRDAAKLLVYHRTDSSSRTSTSGAIQHLHARDLPSLVRPGDLLILNDTRVLPARFVGVRSDTGGKVEGLYVSPGPIERTWTVLLKMKRQRAGIEVALLDSHGAASDVRLRLLERPRGSSENGWTVEVLTGSAPPATTDLSPHSLLERIGRTPLPPYILAARKHREAVTADAKDRERYQTVFARPTGSQEQATQADPARGSVAAPTAGLHFTPELLSRLTASGVQHRKVTLQVGLGTFKPVECEYVDEHPMHAEWCTVPRETTEAIERTRSRGGRIIAVGTTSVRTLESFVSIEDMRERGPRGISTGILITPGYRFKHVDALMTNFHLPRSTLMSLVGAFIQDREHTTSGVERTKALYAEALALGYRFYSYGDAMLIL